MLNGALAGLSFGVALHSALEGHWKTALVAGIVLGLVLGRILLEAGE